MSKWGSYSIGDIAQVFDGPHATPEKTKHGPWFLSISSLDSGRLKLTESVHLSEEDFARWTRRVTPEPGDVLFSYETRLGEAALVPEGVRACLGRRMGLLRPNRKLVDPNFLLFAYLSPEFQATIQSRKIHGATVDRIPLVDLPKWSIRLPHLTEQRAIAAALRALDDKIACNERIAATSSALARTMMRALWCNLGITSLTAEHGPPVAGLERTTLGALCATGGGAVQTGPFGSQLHASDYVELGTPSVMPQNIGDGIILEDGIARVPPEDIARLSKYLLARGDIVYSRRGDVKRCALVRRYETGWLCGTGCLRVRLGDSAEPLFITHYLGEPEVQEWILQHAVGATMPNLNTSILGALPVALPARAVRQRINADLLAIDVRAVHGLYENRVLSALRDTLLPQLMSGKLRVRDVERIVEDAI